MNAADAGVSLSVNQINFGLIDDHLGFHENLLLPEGFYEIFEGNVFLLLA